VFTDFAAGDEQRCIAVIVEMKVSTNQKQIKNKDT